jgi:hypothetical protein
MKQKMMILSYTLNDCISIAEWFEFIPRKCNMLTVNDNPLKIAGMKDMVVYTDLPVNRVSALWKERFHIANAELIFINDIMKDSYNMEAC